MKAARPGDVTLEIIYLENPPSFRIQPDIWVFPKIRVPENGWFIIENPIKIY